MDNLFVWIVLFSGAAIAILGLFLVASERELKKKRGELQDVLIRMENSGGMIEGSEVTGLRAKNNELQKEVAALAYELDETRRDFQAIKASAKQTSGDNAYTEKLRAANEQLNVEIEELRDRLQASEARINHAPQAENSINQQGQFELTIIGLKQQLEASQVRITELENSRPQTTESGLAASDELASKKFQTTIAELEQRIADGAAKLRELDGLRDALAQAQNREESLRQENRRLQQESARWQAQVTEGQEKLKTLGELQSSYDQLLVKHASLAQRQQEFEGELTNFAHLIKVPQPAVKAATLAPPPPAISSSDKERDSRPADRPNPLGSPATEPPIELIAAESTPKRHIRLVYAVIAVAGAAILGLITWYNSTGSSISHAARPVSATVAHNQPPAQPSDNPPAPIAAAVEAPIAARTNYDEPVPRMVRQPVETRAPVQSARTDTRPANAYEITQPTRVFAAPTEFAQQVGDIEPGVKVIVVNAKDGWLEIHSKHGRPPGFIRNHVAKAVAGQQ